MQEIFEVTPRLQVNDSSNIVKLSSISPHGGVLFKKWFNIFKTDVQDGLKLGQNIKVKIVAKTRPLGVRQGPDGKYHTTNYDKVAWVYLPKNPDNETRKLIESYIKAHLSAVKKCYETNVNSLKFSMPTGSVIVKFTVKKNGQLENIVITKNEIPSKALGTCLSKLIKSWIFQTSSHYEQMAVECTFQFNY